MAEFWPESVTAGSFNCLAKLAKEHDVTVIGGWATWLWTGMHKSKDIDVCVSYGELLSLRSEYPVKKNDRLRKYEIKLNDFDIDVYLPKFSSLSLPVDELTGTFRAQKGGFWTISCEALLILKQGALADREGTPKGRKDSIDILSILTLAPFGLEKYLGIVRRHKTLAKYPENLLKTVLSFPAGDAGYVGSGFKEFSSWRKGFVNGFKARR